MSLIPYLRQRWAFGTVLVTLAIASGARAQSSWLGGGASGFWSDAGNWTGGTPVNGNSVSFNNSVTNTANLNTVNDQVTSLSGISIGAIGAGGSTVIIGGNALTLGASGIAMTGATQDLTFNPDLSLSASQSWGLIGGRTLTIGASTSNNLSLSTSAATTLTISWAGAGTAIINSNISDGATASAITTSAGANLAANLQFLGHNTYTGGTTITARTENIQIGSDTAFGTGAITFGAAGNPAVLQATVGPHTLGNNINLNNGFQFGGSNNLTLNGSLTSSVGRAITYNGPAGTVFTFGGPMVFGTSGAAAGTLNASIVSGTATLSSTLVFGGVISEAAGVTSGLIVSLVNGNGTGVSSDQFNAQNTFTGGISLTGQGSTIIAGASSNFAAVPPSGPFGTGTITVNQATNNPRLQAANGAQSVANNFTLTSSLQVLGSNDITLSGVLSGAGGITKLGSNTLNLTGANLYTSATVGTTVTGGTLTVNNTSGSATGTTPVKVTGTGTVGSGGTIGGGNSTALAGFISGPMTISSTTAASQGGTLSPGNSAGTLTMTGSSVTTWDPLGTYLFDHDASATGTAAIGGANNDLLKGTGTSSLNLANLTSGAQFTLFLNPVNFPGSLPTLPVTYTIADFSASTNGTPIVAPAGMIANDLTPFFAITGNFQNVSTPAVTLNNGNQIQVSFTPVPEPAFILAACGGLTALAAWRRSRRRA